MGEKYSGKTHPSEFLSIYTIAMQAAGARDDKVLANYFPLALKPNAMSWLMHLPVDSISSWSDFERQRRARHQSDRRAGPAVSHPAPESPGGLPYEVGCLALTRELRQF